MAGVMVRAGVRFIPGLGVGQALEFRRGLGSGQC